MKTRILILSALMLFVSAMLLTSSYADDRTINKKEKQTKNTSQSKLSRYHALIIGNNNYKHLRKLKTAINDAKEVDRLLREKYGFQTKLLIDATRDDILDGINEFREKLKQDDYLLIYYAGHGQYEKEADAAYWLPVDAQEKSNTKWIIAEDITKNIRMFTSPHILIISDSCYSGTMTRSAPASLGAGNERDEYIKKMLERPSRTLMASGGDEPVADSGGGGNHSVFAAALLTALNEADKDMFTADEMFHERVKRLVAGNSGQVPEYSSLKNSGDKGGDFVFQLAKAGSVGKISRPVEAKKTPEPEVEEPASTNFSIDDIEKKVGSENKKWAAKLNEMKKAYATVLEYLKKSVSPESKESVVERFTSTFSEDIPNTEEDNEMLASVRGELARVKEESQRVAMGRKPAKEELSGGKSSTVPGIITYNGLQWYVGPEQDTNWDQANAWVNSLTVGGGGWRMPTRAELKGLYHKGMGDRNMPPEFKTTGWWVWSNEQQQGSSTAWDFLFNNGHEYTLTRSDSPYFRAFAVRSR